MLVLQRRRLLRMAPPTLRRLAILSRLIVRAMLATLGDAARTTDVDAASVADNYGATTDVRAAAEVSIAPTSRSDEPAVDA
jgi:hypothetical protein